MSRVLFLVHGMGVHGNDWAASVKDKLGEVASRYEKYESPSDFFSRVDIVPITYDHVFTDQLKRWKDASDDLTSFVQKSGIKGIDTSLFDWLSGATEEEDNFFWSHVVDVVLYRYVQDVTKQVRLHVMREIVRTMNDRMKGGKLAQATVVAHSLGTSVTHDSLHLLGSIELDGSRAYTADNFTFKSLFTLANVSRVLETSPGCYTSIVSPRSRERPGGYVRRYYNFRHVVDPFPAVRPFAPVGWASDFVADLALDYFRGFNVHKFEHYLDSPRVHIPLLNALVGRSVSEEEAADAAANYPRVEGVDCKDELDAFVDRAKKIIDLAGDTKDVKRLVIAGAQFFAAAKKAYDAC